MFFFVISDDKTKIVCPIVGCVARFFKIRRHLNRCHPNIKKEDVSMVIDIAKKYSKLPIDFEEPLVEEGKGKKPDYFKEIEEMIPVYNNKRKAMTKKESNYLKKKSCSLCSAVVTRLDLHLQRKHKLDRNSGR